MNLKVMCLGEIQKLRLKKKFMNDIAWDSLQMVSLEGIRNFILGES